MMGTGTFAEPTLEALVAQRYPVVGLVTQPDRSVGVVRGSTRQTGRGMKTIAEESGIPIIQPESINTPEGLAGLKTFQPEMLVVAAYGQILSRDVLAAAPLGGINVHASLLPRYRGAAPSSGPSITARRKPGSPSSACPPPWTPATCWPRKPSTSAPRKRPARSRPGSPPSAHRLAIQVIEQMRRGPVSGRKQDPALVTRAPKMTKEHGLIQWDRTAQQICNQIRAMQPWPTAYTHWLRPGHEPVRLILFKAKALPREMGRQTPGADVGVPPLGGSSAEEPPKGGTPARGSPGDILVKPGDLTRMYVVAGDQGVVCVEELQPSGKRRMTAEEFLRGRRPQPGDRLGPEPT